MPTCRGLAEGRLYVPCCGEAHSGHQSVVSLRASPTRMGGEGVDAVARPRAAPADAVRGCSAGIRLRCVRPEVQHITQEVLLRISGR